MPRVSIDASHMRGDLELLSVKERPQRLRESVRIKGVNDGLDRYVLDIRLIQLDPKSGRDLREVQVLVSPSVSHLDPTGIG